jgi:hypothetical protein
MGHTSLGLIGVGGMRGCRLVAIVAFWTEQLC